MRAAGALSQMLAAVVAGALSLAGCGPAASPPAPVPPGAGPSWAPGLTHAQSRAFLGQVLSHFAERGEVVQIDDGWVVPQGEHAGVRFGLTNVAKSCSAVPEPQWPATIASHFDAVRGSSADMNAWTERLKDWDTARRHLRLRIYPADLAAVIERDALYRVDLPGTFTVPVFDLPQSIQMVPRADPAAWGKSEAEVWAAALANERAASLPRPEPIELGAGLPLLAFEGESFFVASLALRLDQLPGPPPPHGWLVAVPSRDFALAYPVTGLGVMMAVNKLAPLVVKASGTGPGGISRHLYWWDGTTYHRIKVKGEGAQAGVELGEAFTKLVNTLASGD